MSIGSRFWCAAVALGDPARRKAILDAYNEATEERLPDIGQKYLYIYGD